MGKRNQIKVFRKSLFVALILVTVPLVSLQLNYRESEDFYLNYVGKMYTIAENLFT